MKIWLDSFSLRKSIESYMYNTKSMDDCAIDRITINNYVAQANKESHEYSLEDECRPDCECSADCDCAVGDLDNNTSAHTHVGQTCVSDLVNHHLQLADTLHIQHCDTSHWLACNPVGTGHIAVIDEEILSLLHSFAKPAMIREVAMARNTSISALLPVIFIFTRLSFLVDLDLAPVAENQQAVASTLSAWLHITNACNLRCHYCYISKSSDYMEKETSQRAVDAVIRSAVHHGYERMHLKYAGGEVMLQLPQIVTIHDYARQQAQKQKLRLSASLLSNGTIMTQRMIELLKERHIHIMISLDGIGAAHDRQRPYLNGSTGSFSMANRTISRLIENNLRPSINVTVSQRNIAELPALLSYILERDLRFTLSYYRENDCSSSIDDLQFSEKQMIDGMRVAFASIEQQLPRQRIVDSLIDKGNMKAPHRYTCSIGRDYLVINQRGEVAKCQADITHTVTTIQTDDPLQEIRSERTGMQAIDVDQKKGCRTCTWRYWCGGGCPLVTYRMTGRNDLRSPNCAIYKALFPEAVRLEALRLLKYETPISM